MLRPILLTLISLFAAVSLRAQSTNAVGTNSVSTNAPATNEAVREVVGGTNTGNDLASFKILSDRNIFNANRSSRSARNRDATRPVKTESFVLVGTMSTGKGRLAFIDGSSSEFKKAIKVSDSVGGCTVKEIGSKAIKLDAKGKELDLQIGMQMRRQDDGDWQITGRVESVSDYGANRTGTNTTASASSGGSSEAEPSDVLKRLMQQREKELSK